MSGEASPERWWYEAGVRIGRIIAATLLFGCGSGEGDLQVSGSREAGELGYVRCLAAAAPSRAWSLGPLRLRIDEERRLTVEGAPATLRVAVFAGPVDAASVRSLRGRAGLAVVLGELGATRPEVDATLSALAAFEAPVLLVAGGADRRELLRAALEGVEGVGRDRVIDASPLRAVRIGAAELVPLAGAPLGRYAESDGSCGFGESDVEALASALGAAPDGVHRVLVAWAGPEGSPGVDGVEAGSPLVTRLATRIGARGVVFAWPEEQAGRAQAEPLRVGVRPLSGPSRLRADGVRVRPGATLLELRANGVSIVDAPP